MNKVFINDKDIIEVQVIGDQTLSSVQEMGKAIGDFLTSQKQAKKPRLILDDLTQMGKNVDKTAQQEVVNLAKQLEYDRLAMLGNQNPLLRLGANLMFRAIGKGSKLHFFNNREEAEQWLLLSQDV